MRIILSLKRKRQLTSLQMQLSNINILINEMDDKFIYLIELIVAWVLSTELNSLSLWLLIEDSSPSTGAIHTVSNGQHII